MLGSSLWNKLSQIQVATGDTSSGGGSGDGSGGASSQDINKLKTEIADIKTCLTDVCTKGEAESIAADAVSSIGEVYTKEETSSLINEVKSDLGNVYTKDESDSMIAEVKSGLDNVCTADVARSIVAEETAKLLAEAPEDFDTLKEIADWIGEHHDSATAMNTAITDNAANITNLQEAQASKMDTDDIRIISQEEYDALPEEEKTAEFYFITDGPVE